MLRVGRALPELVGNILTRLGVMGTIVPSLGLGWTNDEWSREVWERRVSDLSSPLIF